METALIEFDGTGWPATNEDGSRALYISFGRDFCGANRSMLVGPKITRADLVGEASFCLPLTFSKVVGFPAATVGLASGNCVLEVSDNTSAGFLSAVDFPGALRCA